MTRLQVTVKLVWSDPFIELSLKSYRHSDEISQKIFYCWHAKTYLERYLEGNDGHFRNGTVTRTKFREAVNKKNYYITILKKRIGWPTKSFDIHWNLCRAPFSCTSVESGFQTLFWLCLREANDSQMGIFSKKNFTRH